VENGGEHGGVNPPLLALQSREGRREKRREEKRREEKRREEKRGEERRREEKSGEERRREEKRGEERREKNDYFDQDKSRKKICHHRHRS
jgi:hypothetical protein